MTSEPEKPSRLMREMIELATAMRASGTMDGDTFEQITARTFRSTAPATPPMSGDDIRRIRQEARMSQAVFARYLNLTVGYVSQLERGAKRPTGAALALLNVIQRKGVAVLL